MEIIAGWKDGKIGQNSGPNNNDEDHADQDIYLSGDALDKIWRPDFFFGINDYLSLIVIK